MSGTFQNTRNDQDVHVMFGFGFRFCDQIERSSTQPLHDETSLLRLSRALPIPASLPIGQW